MDRAPDSQMHLQERFDAQRAAFAHEPFPDWPTRRDRLRRLLALIREEAKTLADAVDADFGGRAAPETGLLDMLPSVLTLQDALRHGRRWMRRRRAGVAFWARPASAHILPQPLGVVGIIVPWNYPLYLAVGPLAAALAAGNRAMVKLSEYTPAFSAAFARCVAERFADDEIAIVQGDAEVAEAFAALPFDHLLFTGSTAVGARVMAAAATHLTPVTLELGGKSPAVVAPGYDLSHAASRILFGKLVNAGQTCVAPDYVLLPRGQADAFTAACHAAAAQAYPQGLRSADYTSIVDLRQYGRLLGLLGETRACGARVVPLFDGLQSDDVHHRLAPALVFDTPDTARLMREEIFGPLLPVVEYDTVNEAIAHISQRPRPLALYWFDADRDRTLDALQRTHSGGVAVNDTLMQLTQDGLPFGGIGPSGMGHYHGKWGFDTFSKLKPVFVQSRLASKVLGLVAAPPYGARTRWLLRLLGKL